MNEILYLCGFVGALVITIVFGLFAFLLCFFLFRYIAIAAVFCYCIFKTQEKSVKAEFMEKRFWRFRLFGMIVRPSFILDYCMMEGSHSNSAFFIEFHPLKLPKFRIYEQREAA